MSIGYYKLAPEQIFQNIVRSKKHEKVHIKGIDFLVHPHVYPSERFRTTNFLLDSIESLVANNHICDMGCGFGIVGLFTLKHGAKSVVQADINSLAVKNAKANKKLYGYSKQLKIYTSDCFDRIPKQKFDMIIFNIPFHDEPFTINDPLQYAFHDPAFRTLKKFLYQAERYSHTGTKVIIAFSSKGNVEGLENIFDQSGFEWKLWKATNTHQEFDNRLYMLKI